MKHHLVLSLCILLLVAVLHPTVHAQNPPGWNHGAENVEWKWDEQAASPFGSMDHINPKYDIKLRRKKEPDHLHLLISVLEAEREVFTFEGHFRTVFSIVSDRLYYALFTPYTNGATIVAVDLTAGKELWRSAVFGIGLQQHSRYSNALNLEADSSSVTIFGNEMNGQYFESKSADTGVTKAHRIFTPNETDSTSIGVRNAVHDYYDACRRGYLPYVKRLIEAGLDVKARYHSRSVADNGQTALHLAAEKGAPTVIQYLLDHEHPVDPKDSNDMTPLFIAIHSAEKARTAEQGVAKPRVLSETGLTELQGALQSCQILILRGATLKEPWSTKLQKIAQASGDLELVRMLEKAAPARTSTPAVPAKP